MRLAFNRNLKLIFTAQALSAVGNGLLPPLLPPYFLRLGLTGGDVGALGGIMGLSMAAALLPSAYLADVRGGSRWLWRPRRWARPRRSWPQRGGATS
jgi:hypothetical protein